MIDKENLFIAYSDEYLNWSLGSGDGTHPTNPVRAKIATQLIVDTYPDTVVAAPFLTEHTIANIGLVHDKDYVNDVISGKSSEWYNTRPDLGHTAMMMFAGTVACVEQILSGNHKVAFNPQGAKHHAQYDYSSGFCVFNDMAWAARKFDAEGMKVMYIDWDAHHGDGVENLLRKYSHIVTASIHDGTIWPGTGRSSNPEQGVYNFPMKEKAGDIDFVVAIEEIMRIADEVQPDVVLVAAGADGHKTDPLSTIQFDYPGYLSAASAIAEIANKYANGRVLIGGAGGYQPLTHTPEIWAEVVSHIYENVK